MPRGYSEEAGTTARREDLVWGSGPLRARGRGGEWHSEGSGAQDGVCAAGSAPWSTSVTLLRGEGSQVPR